MAADKATKKKTTKKIENVEETIVVKNEPIVEELIVEAPVVDKVEEPKIVEEVKEPEQVVEKVIEEPADLSPIKEVKPIVNKEAKEEKKNFIPKSILNRCFSFMWNGMTMD